MENKKEYNNTNLPEKSQVALREEAILKLWNDKDIFSKTLSKESPKGEFIFYDGPPFATGMPHYGHILAGTIKDVVPRYMTMKGFHVPRRWGWDCHGLPIENLIEKELGLANKKDIENYGIGAFNQKARSSVMRYAHVWKEQVPRFGRFVDMENEYSTMDTYYTESIWWAFKNLHDKGLIYEGFKSMHMCPRCGTTLSNFEVNQGYKEITDISVYIKFKIKSGQKIASKVVSSTENIFLLAWTTTPWTLPGNAALAVNPDTEYSIFNWSGDTYIMAQELVSKVFKDKEAFDMANTNLLTTKGKNLVGILYEPVFDYYINDKNTKYIENAFRVYGADFVTTTDGTGIVHIAPAFGTDDYNLSLEKNIPFIQHVGTDGKFKKEVRDFVGIDVKPKSSPEEKDAHQKTDVLIIKYLASKNLLFGKEKINHSYPHCWRCETPLLNYASSSWFVSVSKFKDKLVSENKKIEWSPSSVGENRFGNWLKDARDWAISRSRYWGAPLPVWRNEAGDEVFVIGSRAELKKYLKSHNQYWVMRHGESQSNLKGLISNDPLAPDHITETGILEVRKSAQKIKKENINLIITSPFVRTKETAKIVAEEIGMDPEHIVCDERLGEFMVGAFQGKSWSEYDSKYPLNKSDDIVPEGGDTLAGVEQRLVNLIKELENKYRGKKILIVTHSLSARVLLSMALGYSRKEIKKITLVPGKQYFANAGIEKFDFTPFPRNENGEIDLHRPYIDEVDIRDSKGQKMSRIKDVFDCWFESGAMPFAKVNYTGEPVSKFETTFDPRKGLFKKSCGYPANFIAEGLDQTRGWFYSMLVLGVALFGHSPYKKVIVNGLILAEDGKKMSKSLKNYPDPMDMINRYGMDAIRLYLLSSPVVLSEDLRFSPAGVDEILKKVINRLDNVLSFYKMYTKQSSSQEESVDSENILDIWIKSRLSETEQDISSALEVYELNRAIRPIFDFVDDLSTWYLRRSRDRFKTNDNDEFIEAYSTLGYVLLEFSKLVAPFAPFIADDIYTSLNGQNESVHLESWPKFGPVNLKVLEQMKEVRKISSAGLLARAKAKIAVRQPLSKITINSRTPKLDSELESIVLDEINVDMLEYGDIDDDCVLDMDITPALRKRGFEREIIRAVQEARKNANLNPNDSAEIVFYTSQKGREFITSIVDVIKSTSNTVEISFAELTGESVKVDDFEIIVSAKKV